MYIKMLEIISYYNVIYTNVYALFLDANKAFDRVHYGILFKDLCEQQMSPLVTRLLLYIYTNQNLQDKMGVMFNQFGGLNGVK